MLSSPWGVSQASTGDAEREQFFEAKIRPVLAEHCFECHAESSKRVKGSLKLDSAAALALGGDSGAVIVAGDPDASLLVRALRYSDPEVEMPPKGKLDPAIVADFEEWVRQGAYFPAPADSPTSAAARAAIDFTRSDHWAFQPMAKPEVSKVHNSAWVHNPIDAFVLAGLEKQGLQPAPPTSKHVWLRRATFDLTGLPPTPEELDAFLQDESPQAYERVVDGLLSRPQYGERWARHWLDLARYADSNGLDENLAMANAWRYRDWVVRALNRDLPYDQFVQQQLAGDLLVPASGDAEAAEPLAATGFLVLGPKMLAEQDKAKLVIDVVDEQLDVLTKTFMGLTVSCARCHDHKFDPISQRDYYALAGILKSTRTLGSTDFVSRWNEVPLATPAEREAREAYEKAHQAAAQAIEAELERQRREVQARWERDLARYFLEGWERARETLWIEAQNFSRASAIVDKQQWGSADQPIVRTGSGARPQYAEYEFELAFPGSYELWARYAAEESRPVRLSVDGVLLNAKAMADKTGSWFLAGQRWAVQGRVDLAAGQHLLRFESDDHLPHIASFAWMPASAELAVASSSDHASSDADFADPDLAQAADSAGACETATPQAPLEPYLLQRFALRSAAALQGHDPILSLWVEFARLPQDEFASYAADLAVMLREEHAKGAWALNPALLGLLHAPAPSSMEELAARYQSVLTLIAEEWRALKTRDAKAEKLPDPAHEALREFLLGVDGVLAVAREQVDQALSPAALATIQHLRQQLSALEAQAPRDIPLVLAVSESKVEDLPVHIRGSHLKLEAQAVPRGVPTVLATQLPGPTFPSEHSGRKELAEWLTHPENPLTARVMVNRLWRGHFGRGIVESPSNFGVRGEVPTHPELLDWLARDFIAGGWSIKRMHKQIMLSSAYRMSSVPTPELLERDPENRAISRMNRRRLEAEAVRDGMLAVAGKLDLSLEGTLLMAGNGDYVTNDQSGNSADYSSHRRSLYLPLIRNAIYDLFSTFDYPDPGMAMELRSSTTDANQALLLMNSPLALEASAGLAERLLADGSVSDTQRLDRAWELVYGRSASTKERERALNWLADASAQAAGGRQDAWQALCQMLLASNEFLHID